MATSLIYVSVEKQRFTEEVAFLGEKFGFHARVRVRAHTQKLQTTPICTSLTHTQLPLKPPTHNTPPHQHVTCSSFGRKSNNKRVNYLCMQICVVCKSRIC